jgi:hypothetical protein
MFDDDDDDDDKEYRTRRMHTGYFWKNILVSGQIEDTKYIKE